MKFSSIFFLLFGCIFLSACSELPLSPEDQLKVNLLNEKANNVGIIYSLTATEVNQFRELGPVDCKIYWKNINDKPEENCRRKLKLLAAELGGTLVVIEQKTNFKCTAGLPDNDCVEMKGRAYILK